MVAGTTTGLQKVFAGSGGLELLGAVFFRQARFRTDSLEKPNALAWCSSTRAGFTSPAPPTQLSGQDRLLTLPQTQSDATSCSCCCLHLHDPILFSTSGRLPNILQSPPKSHLLLKPFPKAPSIGNY